MGEWRPPDTAAYDIREATQEQITVGTVYRFTRVSEGTITGIGPAPTAEDPFYSFFWSGGFAWVPDPVLAPAADWESIIERRFPDPALRATRVLPDGSAWIYFVDELGPYFYCGLSGSNHEAGDLIRGDEPLYQAEAGPAAVQVGRRYRFVTYQTGTVTAVYPPGHPNAQPGSWTYDVTLISGAPVQVIWHLELPDYLDLRAWARIPKPAAGTKWRAADRSEWVWPGAVPFYRCYAAGSRWPINTCARAEDIGELVSVV